jgi:hypothetical protein
MEIFKCKLDKFGKVDKLKCRIVFRGDLYSPTDDIDSWNPHATWTSLKYYLGLCAYYKIYPAQIDFVMAYVQTEMREEKVYVKFPEFWHKLLPEDLQPYAGTPLLLLKALYGYRHSGKFLLGRPSRIPSCRTTQTSPWHACPLDQQTPQRRCTYCFAIL